MANSEKDFGRAVNRLATLPYFPSDPSVRAEIGMELLAMCPHQDALDFIVSTTLAKCNAWPGLKELRGILCSRYAPADGTPAECTIAGLTAADGERKYLEEHNYQQPRIMLCAAREPETVSEDPEMDAKIHDLAKKTSMNVRSLLPGPEYARMLQVNQILEGMGL